jgi:predicted transcriptional regulator of viral defense system
MSNFTSNSSIKALTVQGIFRSRDLEATGISRTAIRRLTQQGLLEKVGHGLYRSPQVKLSERADLALAAKRVPGGVLCLLSALRFHRLTTQNPFEVWMAIGVKAWRPRPAHPPLRLIYLTVDSLSDGVEEHEIDGIKVKVFSAARTVVDCFRFRNKVGIDVAVEALRDYRRVNPKGLDALWRFAERGRMTKVITPYLQATG